MSYGFKNAIAGAGMLFFCVLFASAEVKRERPEFSFAREIEAAALEELAETAAPSLQISIGQGNDIVYEGAFGLADIENQVKATPRSKYRTASVAKWFTATLAMRLMETGTLDLDEPIQTYCPEFPPKNIGAITSRQLLTHTSGIRHYLDFEAALESR